MKIQSFSIKNFKSIDTLENFEFLDSQIVCLIGRNGSGKSNLLLALNALKDDKDLLDENRYEKSKKEEQIEISAVIMFDDSDKPKLEELSLNASEIQGFKVVVVKNLGQPQVREIEPIEFKKDFTQKIKKHLSKISSFLKNINVPDEEQAQKEELISKLQPTDEINKQETSKSLDSVANIVSKSDQLNAEDKESHNNLIQQTKGLLQFEINKILEENFWQELSINLLDPTTYQVLDSAPLDQLDKNVAYKFLYDLIRLTDKNIKDFKKSGTELMNIIDEASTSLTDTLSQIWKDHKIVLELAIQDGALVFAFKTPQERRLGLSNLSDGEQWFLRFYTALAIAEKENKQTIWLFDEPGKSLHATSQANLKEFFESVANKPQMIYTTHQPMMIQWHRLERIYLVENDPKDGTKILERLWKDEEIESPLREALSLFIGEEFLTGKEHVIVEGVSDYYYLLGWLIFFQSTRTSKQWSEDYAIFNRTIVPANNRDQIPLYLLYLTKKTKHKVNAIGVPDSKADEEVVKTVLQKRSLDPLFKRIVSVATLVGDNGLKSIEDLFTPQEYLSQVVEYYKSRTEYFNIKFPSNFVKPKRSELKDGIIKYVESKLISENRDVFAEEDKSLDKPGIAQHVYKKLIKDKNQPFSKETEKRFEKVFKGINKIFTNDKKS